ncbi:DNA primase [Gordonia phage BiteSize]|uniref:DNA primase n=1 Tax=Gordonia phage BiteSize TaxID=2759394 RepID=A0A7L7SJQ3_9CAUD|nr:DNA primase [Gordonia phage BiteSize]
MGELANINRGRPFKNRAKEYLKKGMHPIPLPAGQKFPPPTGWTGRNAPAVTFEQIDEWFSEGRGADRSNVGLHMFEVFLPSGEPATVPDPEWDGSSSDSDSGVSVPPQVPATLIGIDVDHYDDKTGGDTLRRLERKLGELPPTWTSSSRNDGISGIRYFLAPAKYEYLGKVGDDIECIQKKHRFAVVYPSWHPQGGQYVWYPPGCAPGGVPCTYTPPGTVTHTKSENASGLVTFQFRRSSESVGEEQCTGDEIPNAWEFPALPKRWIEHLTKEFQHETSGAIDMETSVDGIYKWARKQFKQKGGKSKSSQETALAELREFGCSQMKKRVEANVEKIMNSSTSHEELRDAHWEIFRMGAEGHAGWMAASRIVEFAWLDRVMGGTGKNQKRALDEAHREMFRSRTNGLRKIKAQIDNQAAGVPGKRVRVSEKCACYEGDGEDLGDLGFDLSSHSARDPGAYERNDDGNGEHFVDLYADKFYFVEGYERWIYWNGEHWVWDEQGMARRAFRVVKKRQQKYADQLMREAEMAKAADSPDAKALAAKAKMWNMWATNSGNNRAAEGALKAAQAYAGISVTSDVTDGNPALLGVKNGTIELRQDGPFFRKAEKEDWVVSNTNVMYVRREDLLRVGGDLAEGVRLFDSYLEKFQPDPSVRLWLQQVMGMCLLGYNQEKKFVWFHGESHTGKSTMLNLVMHALGQYAGSAELSIFQSTKLNPALAEALPWRVLTTSEANATKGALTADMLKRLTGNDPMNAEMKNSNTIIRRVPAFVPIVATNNAPHIDGMDDAMKQRFEIIPFDVVQKPQDAPLDIEREMMEKSLPAVLAWLVEGWRIYCENRLRNRPDSLVPATAKFVQEVAGDIGIFMEDMLILTGDDEDFATADEVYNAYRRWASQNKIKEHDVLDKPRFGKRMSKSGYAAKPKWDGELKKAVRVYVGIKLQESAKNVVKFSHQVEK